MAASKGDGFRLATYNLQNLGRADNPGQVYDRKLEFLTGVLRELDADLVVVNEIREPDSFEDLAAGLEFYTDRFLGDAPTDTRRIQIGILTRLEVLARGQWYEFPTVVPGRGGEVESAKFRRPVPWVKVRVPDGQVLLAAGVHLKSDRPEVESLPDSELPRRRVVLGHALSVTGRTMEAAGLRCLVDSAMGRRSADHYAVIGDFNDGPESDQVRLVMGVEGDLSWAGDGERLVLGSTSRLVPAESRISYSGRMRQELLDHILISRELDARLVRAGIEVRLLQGPRDKGTEGRQQGYPRSDHAPVWADFGSDD